jgi:hypothetical protein
VELDIILSELEQNRGYFPREAVEEAMRRKEEITPHLVRSLQEAAATPVKPKDGETSFFPLYAMYLLAQFREPRAYPIIMELCRHPRESLEALIGDTISNGLSHIIASVFDGDVMPIKSIIENSSVDEYVRGSAIHSLSILVYEGVLDRADVITYLAELFRTRLEKEYSHVWDALASEATDLHAISLADDIRGAYEKELLWPGYMQPEEVDRIFAMQEEVVLAKSKEQHGGLIDDVVEEMHWWACFKPQESRPLENGEPFFDQAGLHARVGTVVRSEPKIGRNAPCSCGSGKKYKKCCGR